MQFGAISATAVRAMDRVCDVSLYPLEQQRTEALNKRRMGLGVTGLANAIEAIGHRAYGVASGSSIRSRHSGYASR
jgi:hypothetical protein